MKLVAVANQKGGVGKTTVTMNLAAVIANHGSRVLVVDVDPQQSATWWADRAREAFDGETGGADLPFDLATDTDPGVLARLREQPYDVVLVDTPGSLEAGDVLGAVLDAVDFAILPTEPDPLAIVALVETIRRVITPRQLAYRVLINRVDPRLPADAADAAELLDANGLSRFEGYLRAYKVHRRSPLVGSVVGATQAARAATNPAADFQRIALELMSQWANANIKEK